MGPERALPCSPEFETSEQYVDTLLDFIGSSELLHALCGGVHVLDFFTRKPDLYTLVIDSEWRSFFRAHDIMDILDLLMREDLNIFNQETNSWREGPVPPESLLQFIKQIRRLSLRREHTPIERKNQKGTNGPKTSHTLARQVAVGMNVKKIHEVDNFCRYLDRLTSEIAGSTNQEITHLVDFGAGQNYLGRALASEPYNKHIIALESRAHNIEGARNWDVLAKLAPKQQTMVNKKEWRKAMAEQGISEKEALKQDLKGERGFHAETPVEEQPAQATLKISNQGVGSIQYVEHYIKDGDLSRVVPQIVDQDVVREKVTSDLDTAAAQPPSSKQIPDNFVEGNLQVDDSIKAQDPRLLIISLHSCGNLVHHGIRSLLLNPAVSAVALVGCCYNLLTERLGPPTYKLPSLRSNHPRLTETSEAHDPHGFPMSSRLCNQSTSSGKGLRLNITARMMAVQAPQNWGKKDSEDFFKRHFYRALLQRIFMDKGIVAAPEPEDVEKNNGSPLGWSAGGGTAPIILGSLRKSCYESFTAYVRGALDKLVNDPTRGDLFKEKMCSMTDDEIRNYETEFKERGKELSVMWSLMAFSAGVIEAAIVVDRYLFLREQDEVADAWVEAVFEFKHSPRNLVVVGIKK
ncbi:unnamed protein product [Aureobasidium uvarum]|uniref:Methyltransferase domain-containing protein n=1 Tax=Aureobasidium uvarum TaxID=2773716 RepID=A0A9N8KR27_9PEZI|nr:unnamed protein product [Aureobasidium uvarum]